MIPLRNKQVETWWVDNQYLQLFLGQMEDVYWPLHRTRHARNRSEDAHVTIYSFLKDQHERTTFFKLSGEIVARRRAKMGLL